MNWWIFAVILLVVDWTEGALPGQACSAANPCTGSVCCNGYCSACCSDSHCPASDYCNAYPLPAVCLRGDICVVQNPAPATGANYRTCFPAMSRAVGEPCWRNQMCNDTYCNGGSQSASSYAITVGKCTATAGSFLTSGQSIVADQVYYRAADESVIWSSNTYNTLARKLTMRTDGNLVLTDTAEAKVFWSTNTTMAGNLLSVTDQGVLIVFTSGSLKAWRSSTNQIIGSC